MYERFTDRSRKVMALANAEAVRFGHEFVGTEHVLIGLLLEGSGVAANVLKNLDISLGELRKQTDKCVQPGPSRPDAGITAFSPSVTLLPLSPRSKKVVEYAQDEATRLQHNYVGTEHVLLGLLREGDGVAAQVLMNCGVKLEDVRDEVLNLLGEPNSRERQQMSAEHRKYAELLFKVATDPFAAAAEIKKQLEGVKPGSADHEAIMGLLVKLDTRYGNGVPPEPTLE